MIKREEREMEVIIHGEIDLAKIPKGLFEIFISALAESVETTAQDKLQTKD